MRRLLVFVSVVVAMDTLFFTALTPLLPHFADKYGLSKAGAGVFISAYAAGTLIGAIPAGLATTRLGPKRTVLAGLSLMTAASLGFALAGNVWALGASRLFQGVGSSFSWAGGLAWLIASAPRERRGTLLGTASLVVARRGDKPSMGLAALLLTLAIVSHHFTAMGAVEIVPDPTRAIDTFASSSRSARAMMSRRSQSRNQAVCETPSSETVITATTTAVT